MNLKSEKLFIDETDHVEKRAERSEDAHQQALAEQGSIAERLQELEGEKASNAMASLAEQQKLYGLLILLASVLGLADCPIQYALNSVAFPNLWWLVLIIISLLVAAGLGVVVEVAAFAMFFDPYRPRRTVRLCLAAAGISGALAAAAATVMLFSRTASGEIVGFLAQVVPVSMWVLGESLPVAAGFLSAAAWTLGYPQRRDNKIDKLKQRLSALNRFIDWLDRDKQKVGRVVVMLLVCLLVTAPAFSQGALAPSAGGATFSSVPTAGKASGTSAQSGMAAPSAAPSGRCLIYVDMTASVDPEFRRQTVLRITDTIPHFIAAFRCATLSVGTFADEGPFAPMTEIQVDQPAPPDDCTRATYKVEGLQKITANLSGFRDYYQQRAATACRERTEAQSVALRQKSQDIVAQIGAVLNPDLPARGQCTALYSLLSRAVTLGATVMAATDGVETCERTPQTVILPNHGRLIFVLLPSRGSLNHAGRSALRVGAEWQRRVPGVQVVLPPEVSPRLWGDLASQPR